MEVSGTMGVSPFMETSILVCSELGISTFMYMKKIEEGFKQPIM